MHKLINEQRKVIMYELILILIDLSSGVRQLLELSQEILQ